MLQIGQFRFIESIGKGGTSQVWRGEHVVHKTMVAIKVMNSHWMERAGARSAFQREVKSMARMNHPNIVRIFDLNLIKRENEERSFNTLRSGSPCVMMELAEFGTLQRLKRRLDWDRFQIIIVSILDALGHAHARKVLHADLKPGNILITKLGPKPQIKLADFGLSHGLQQVISGEKIETTSGTPRYMAPEQARGRQRDYGPWTDLYALGCVIYALLNGRPPYSGEVDEVLRDHLFSDLPPLRANFELPPGFHDWLLKLMAKDWRKRFHCAADATLSFLSLNRVSGNAFSFERLDSAEERAKEITHVELSSLYLNPQDATGEWDVEPPNPENFELSPFVIQRKEKEKEKNALSLQLVGTGLSLFGIRAIPFVGREKERDILWGKLQKVHQTKRCHFVTIKAAKGVGKSRLTNWFAQRAHEVSGITSIFVKHNSPSSPRDGIIPALRTFLGCDNLTERLTKKRLQKLYFRTGGLKEQDLLDCQSMASAFTYQDVDTASEPKIYFQSPREFFVVLQRILKRIAFQRPLLFVIDDAQWALEARAFMEFLLEKRDLSLLVIAVLREDALSENERLHWQEMDRSLKVDAISLPVLEATEHKKLVEQLLPLDAKLVHAISKRTHGNPLFAVQLIEDWVQRGILEFSELGFVIREGEEIALPDSIQQVWKARISQLHELFPTASSVLYVGSLLGLDVDQFEWERTCRLLGLEIPPSLIPHLSLNRLLNTTDTGWVFIHSMLHESLMTMGSSAFSSEEVHNRIVEVLEESEDESPSHQLRIAEHCVKALRRKKALRFFESCARNFFLCGEDEASKNAIQKYDRTLEDMNVPLSDPRWGELVPLKLDIGHNLWDIEGMKALFRKTEKIPKKYWVRVRPLILIRKAASELRAGNSEEAKALFDKVLSMQLESETRVDCYYRLGAWAFYQGMLTESIAYLEEARDLLALTPSNLVLERKVLESIVFPLLRIGELERAYQYAQRAIEISVLQGDRTMEAKSLSQIGKIELKRNNLEAAREAQERAISLLKSTGSWRIRFSQLGLAQIYIELGEYQSALEGFRSADPDEEYYVWDAIGECAAFAGLQMWPEMMEKLEYAQQGFEKLSMVDFEIIELIEKAIEVCKLYERREELRQLYAFKILLCNNLNRFEESERIRAELLLLSVGNDSA